MAPDRRRARKPTHPFIARRRGRAQVRTPLPPQTRVQLWHRPEEATPSHLQLLSQGCLITKPSLFTHPEETERNTSTENSKATSTDQTLIRTGAHKRSASPPPRLRCNPATSAGGTARSPRSCQGVSRHPVHIVTSSAASNKPNRCPSGQRCEELPPLVCRSCTEQSRLLASLPILGNHRRLFGSGFSARLSCL